MKAVELLGSYGPAAKDAAPALREALGDDNHACRVFAAEALWKVEPRSPEALAALKESSRTRTPTSANRRRGFSNNWTRQRRPARLNC